MNRGQAQVLEGVYVVRGIDAGEELEPIDLPTEKRNPISRKSAFQPMGRVYWSTSGSSASGDDAILDLIEQYVPSNKSPKMSAELIKGIAERRTKSGQEWFWSEEWQTAEKEAEADLQAGRFETFDTMEDFLADLE